MSNFDAIRAFYKAEEKAIMSAKKNEWAIPPNSWEGIISMTPIELAIWERLRNINAVMYPQYPVGRYFADFANPIAKAVIECDGKQFHLDKEKDARRDKEFEMMGWAVYRITGSECFSQDDPEISEVSSTTEFINDFCRYYGLVRSNSGTQYFGNEYAKCFEFLLSK